MAKPIAIVREKSSDGLVWRFWRADRKAANDARVLSSPALSLASAASSGVIAGNMSYIRVGAIIGVRTSGMWIVVKVMLSPIVSDETTRVNASSADFEAT